MIILVILVALMATSSYYLYTLNTTLYLLPVWIISSILAVVILFLLFILLLLPIFNRVSYTNKFKHFFLRQVLQMLCLFSRTSLKVENKEKLINDKNVPLVLVSNHKSLLDPVWHYLMMGRPFSAAAKSTLNKVPLFGRFATAFQAVSINRSSDREAAKSIIKGSKYVEAGLGLIIYPEGGIKTRDTEQMVELKPGAYKLATKARATIQVVATHNNTHPSRRRTLFSWTTVKIIVLDSISYEEYKDLTTTELGLEISKRVNATFEGERIEVSVT